MSRSCNCDSPNRCTCNSRSYISSTEDDIRILCRSDPFINCTDSNRSSSGRSSKCERRNGRYDPGISYFNSIITPLSNLTPGFSGCMGSVEFKMRRKNKTVTLQWEPFTGTLTANGVSFLTVCQSICNTPPYPISIPIYIIYKGSGRITHVEIDPFAKSGNIKFYLNTDGSGSDINSGDNISFPGGSISWIVN